MLESIIPRKAVESVVNGETGWESAFQYLVDNSVKAGKIPPTANNATQFATVYACINVLGDDIAKLPWKSYKNHKNYIEKDSSSDVSHVLNVRPNRFMNPFVYKKLIITDICTYGNHFSYISFDKRGEIDELIPLDPSNTQVVVDRKTREYGYQTTYKNNPSRSYHTKSSTLKPYQKMESWVFHHFNRFVSKCPRWILRLRSIKEWLRKAVVHKGF